jgi:hypothetical protein
MVRAKFRVMTVTREHNGDTTTVRLLPVMADEAEENRSFWSATPSGEIELRFTGGDSPHLGVALGSCVYVDMEPVDEHGPDDLPWRLLSLQRTGEEPTHVSLDVCLILRWDARPDIRMGKVDMSIERVSTFPAFEEPGVGTRWRVSFTPA